MSVNMSLKLQQLFRTRAKFLKYIPSVRCSQSFSPEVEIDESVEKKVTVLDSLKNLSVPFEVGHTCFTIKNCSVCPAKKTKSPTKNDIFINKHTGFFVCELCKISGSWEKFNLFYKAAKDKSPKEVATLKNDFTKYNQSLTNWGSILTDSTLLCESDENEISKVLNNFGLAVVSKEILKKLHVRVNKAKDMLYFPLLFTGQIVGYKTLDLMRKSTTTPKVECGGCLYIANSRKAAIIVSNIHDFFALISYPKLPQDIVCLPYGVSNLPQNVLPFLESYEKLTLWLGEGSLNAVGSFANKLNEKRCFIIRSTENQTSAEVAFLNKEDIMKIISEAKSMCHDHIITFHALRDEVLSEIQNRELHAGVQWQRFPRLNQILKGHRRGELTVLTGPTGVGKTTFMSEYSLDLAMQGVNTLWGSFEIKNSRLAKVMLQQFSGEPLSDNAEEFAALANRFEELPLFFMTFHGHQNMKVVMDALEHCSYTYDIAHVVIDNIQFMIELPHDGYKMERFWKQDCLIQAFRNFASKNNCHVSLVMHPKKELTEELGVNSVFGGGKATQEADNVLIIQKKSNGYGDKKYLQVFKNRYSGDLGSMRLIFDKNSLSFKDKGKSFIKEEEPFPEYIPEENFKNPLIDEYKNSGVEYM